jgi:hypothetical protein
VRNRFPGTFAPKTAGKTGTGLVLDTDWAPGATRFHVFGAVTFKVPQDIDAEGGAWCSPRLAEADYT